MMSITPKDKEFNLIDNGTRRVYSSGAIREDGAGKGRCDLLPIDVLSILCGRMAPSHGTESIIFMFINNFKNTKNVNYLYSAIECFCGTYYDNIYTGFLDVSIHYEEGAKKYGDNNWKKGLPLHRYIDSAIRHFLKFLKEDVDEPHGRAFLWNIIGAIWTFENKPELDDIQTDLSEDPSKHLRENDSDFFKAEAKNV